MRAPPLERLKDLAVTLKREGVSEPDICASVLALAVWIHKCNKGTREDFNELTDMVWEKIPTR